MESSENNIKPNNDYSEEIISDWAISVGYEPEIVLLKEKKLDFEWNSPPERPSKIRKKTKVSKLKEKDIELIDESPSSLDVEWDKMTITKGLKGGGIKKVCLVNFGGEEMVLKGAIGTPESHVLASKFIGDLGLDGIKVPVTRVLVEKEKSSLVKKLAKGDKDQVEMSEALQNGTGQLSKLVPGVAIDKVFLPGIERKAIDNAFEIRKNILESGLKQDEAWEMVCQEIYEKGGAGLQADMARYLKGTVENWDEISWDGKKKAAFVTLASLKDSNKRKEALEELVKLASAKPLDRNMVKILSEVCEDDWLDALEVSVKYEEEEEIKRQDTGEKLIEWSQSDEGIKSFAGVAVCDLLIGMNDRIMGEWNGGNFLFDDDPNGFSLCCIDNSKVTQMGLNENEYEEGYWQEWFSNAIAQQGPLANVIFDSIYRENGSNVDALGNFCEFNEEGKAEAKKIILEVIENVIDKIENDKNASQLLLDRMEFIREKLYEDMALEQNLRDLFEFSGVFVSPVNDIPEDLKFTKKVGRLFKKTPRTGKIKKKLRKGKIEVSKAEIELKNKNLKDNKDRRVVKIEWMIEATRYKEALDAVSNQLKIFLQSGPSDGFINLARDMAAPLAQVFEEWWTHTNADKKIKENLKGAWENLPDEIRPKVQIN